MSKLIVGKNVRIPTNIMIYGKVIVGNNTIIEDNVVIGHPTDEMYRMYRKKKYNDSFFDSTKTSTRIGNDCIIKSGTIIYVGAKIGNNVLCGHNCYIGEYSVINNNSKLFNGTRIYANVKIGKHARINGFCCDRSQIGDNVSMLGELVHKYPIPIGGLKEKAPIIKNNAVIGMSAIVIGDIVIGEGAYIGAGAIVIKNIPANVYAVGIPAKFLRKRRKINLSKYRDAMTND